VACRLSPLNSSQRGETSTTSDTSLGSGFKVGILVVRLHYFLLAPWIVLAVPSQVFLGVGILLVLVIIVAGSSGMFAGKQVLATLASVILLVLLVAGKVGTDLAKAPSPDTAVLLLQFVAIIFFMEASRVVLSFNQETRELAGKTDEMSQAIKGRLELWVKGQLGKQASLMIGALGLSLVLLVLGGFTSISINQLAFSAILVLFVIAALIFLITQKREPETRPSSARVEAEPLQRRNLGCYETVRPKPHSAAMPCNSGYFRWPIRTVHSCDARLGRQDPLFFEMFAVWHG